MRRKAQPKVHNWRNRKQREEKEPRLRRSHGPKSRSRISLTTPSSSTRSSSRECSRRSPRSSALPEPFFAKSSRSADPWLVPSSRTSQRETSSSQSEPSTAHSISTRVPRPRVLPRDSRTKLNKKERRRRRVTEQQKTNLLSRLEVISRDHAEIFLGIRQLDLVSGV